MRNGAQVEMDGRGTFWQRGDSEFDAEGTFAQVDAGLLSREQALQMMADSLKGDAAEAIWRIRKQTAHISQGLLDLAHQTGTATRNAADQSARETLWNASIAASTLRRAIQLESSLDQESLSELDSQVSTMFQEANDLAHSMVVQGRRQAWNLLVGARIESNRLWRQAEDQIASLKADLDSQIQEIVSLAGQRGLWDSIKEKASQIASSVKEKVSETAAAVVEKAKQTASDVTQAVKEKASQAADAIKETAAKVKDKIEETAGKVADKVMEKVPDSVKEMASDLADKARDAASAVKDKAKQALQTAKDAVKDAVDKAKEAATNLGYKVAEKLGMGDLRPDDEDEFPDGGSSDDPYGSDDSDFPYDDYFSYPDDYQTDPDSGTDPDSDWPTEEELAQDSDYPTSDEMAADSDWPTEEELAEDSEWPSDEELAQDSDAPIDSPSGDPSSPSGDSPSPSDEGSGESSDDGTTTPTSDSDSPQEQDKGLQEKENSNPTLGWRGVPPEIPQGIAALMHDGDQQLFNPYGHEAGLWTTYSFRPSDAKQSWPQLAITPASFMALDSMDTMLDNVPYIVVKEYFFKNTASTMMNLIKKLMDKATEAKSSADAAGSDTSTDVSSQGSGEASSSGNSLLDKIKDKFQNVSTKLSVIDIPYVLYCGLRKKMYGNTYVFPYIVGNSTVINEASNQSEWGKGTGLIEQLKGAIESVGQMLGGIAASAMGSQARGATLFPAPTWNPSGDGQGVQFSFDLMLLNDNAVKARNNYMCVNTIIHNNRSIQKAILQFPGALYELWLPTGQRHLMCTADFKLYPLGINRQTPDGFFDAQSNPGANFDIGVSDAQVAQIKNKHVAGVEVLPDGYKLSCNFKSCLANNMNTAVFQYYVEMTPYDSYSGNTGGESNDDAFAKTQDAIEAAMDKGNKANSSSAQTAAPAQQQKSARSFQRAVSEALSLAESFEESTYNRRIDRLNSSMGDLSLTADSAVQTLRSAQRTIRQSRKFLDRLYGAKTARLWHSSIDPMDEWYTTLRPDDVQLLRKRYRDEFRSLRQTERKSRTVERQVRAIEERLRGTLDLAARTELISRKVDLNQRLQNLAERKTSISDSLLQIDQDLISHSMQVQDRTTSVAKRQLKASIFQQAWNEGILNPYERETIQYMTSKEKDRYYQDKVRELRKADPNGLLNHPDWFVRAVVLDFVVQEMEGLVDWFKNCRYDDFETIYRIVRKLNLLQMDAESTWTAETFSLNQTNLFQLPESELMEFTKLDSLLEKNTLWELLSSNQRLSFTVKASAQTTQSTTQKDVELVQEQRSELDAAKRRTWRQEIVVRNWGSESELTKAAYTRANESSGVVGVEGTDGVLGRKMSISDVKARIMELKLKESPTAEDRDTLRRLLGGFSNYVACVKEAMVMEAAQTMSDQAEG